MGERECSDSYTKVSWKETGLLLFFFLVSVLYAYLIHDPASSDRFALPVLVLKWIYLISTEASIVYMGWRLYNKNISMEKFLGISGIFVISQFVGIIYLRLFNWNTPILILDILLQWKFYLPYVCILIFAILYNKDQVYKKPLIYKNLKIGAICIALLLLLPIICSTSRYIYGDIVNGVNGGEYSIWFEFLLGRVNGRENISLAASDIMDFLMTANIRIRLFYYACVGILILLMGIKLLRGKMTFLCYFALGGGYIITQFIGINSFDGFLNLFREFDSSNINMILHILTDYKFTGLYLSFVLIRTIMFLPSAENSM